MNSPLDNGATLNTNLPWTCPSCNRAVSTPYCSECGEHPPHAGDLTLRGFIGQVARAVTNIDGRLIRSFRCLVARPGALTVAYVRGQRQLYSTPLQLFFLANVLFFALHSPTGAKIFAAPLDSHLHTQPWGDVAQRLITRHLDAAHTTMELYSPVFDQAVELHAKSLVGLMVLPFALLPPILFYRNRRPFIAHVVFSIHFYSFLLLLFCLALVFLGVNQLFGGPGLESESLDHFLTWMLLAGCALYFYRAIGTFYGTSGATRLLKVAVLTTAVACTVLGYRFALLLITLYST